MSVVVLDTDAASSTLRRKASASLAQALVGQVPAITFVTLGELTKWTLVWHRGPRSLNTMRAFDAPVGAVDGDERVRGDGVAVADRGQHVLVGGTSRPTPTATR